MITSKDYEKYKQDFFNLLLFIMELEANTIDEFKACEKIEDANIPLVCLDMLMQYAIDYQHPHIYLIALKKKEELNGFSQTNNFEL